MTAPSDLAKHPAKFNSAILDVIDRELPKEGRLIDNFAGVGLIHTIGRDSVGIEIEEEWAKQHPQNIVGDALHLPFRDKVFKLASSSSTYGNRMGDHHDAKDTHKKCNGQGCAGCWYRGVTLRHTYTHYLGRSLHKNNTGGHNWGKVYKDLHVAAWAELWRVMDDDSTFAFNIKNHIRHWKEIDVVGWHTDVLVGLGFRLDRTIEVPSPGLRHGANADLRNPNEMVLIFVKGKGA